MLRPGTVLTVVAVALTAFAAEEQAAEPNNVRAAFARRDITPAVGAEMPGGFGKHISQGVHDPLMTEACVITNGTTTLALVGLDACMVPDMVVAETRRLVEEACGFPGANVMIAANHTHIGGPLVDVFGSESDPAYMQLVAEKTAEAIAEAFQKAQPARIGIGTGYEDSVGFNRRFRMKDGTVKTHPGKMNPDIIEPEGPIDPEMGVIGVQGEDGAYIGCIVNYALHGTVVGGNGFGGDWPYYMRETIRKVMGADTGVVFLNGACGDVTQVDNRNARSGEFGEAWGVRIGTILGAEALKVLAPMEYKPNVALSVITQPVKLPIRELNGTDEEVVQRESPVSGLGSGTARDEVYIREVGLVRAMREQAPEVDSEIQVMQIGDAAIATNTTEFFASLGLAIKEASPWAYTFVSELTNGYDGYAPTRAAFDGGGYEVRTARSSFIAPGAGEQIVDESIALLKQLHEQNAQVAAAQAQ